MTYKTPLHPEVQAALSVGVREAIQPLSKPDRLMWQPVLTSYTYSLAKDLQVREAQRAERSRKYHPECPVDGSPYPLSENCAQSVLTAMNSVFKACYGQEGGRERMAGLVAQNQKSRTAALQEMNIHAMARRDSLPSKLQSAGPEID